MDQQVAAENGMRHVLEAQRTSFLSEREASAALRRDRLSRLLAMTLAGQGRIVEAIRADYAGLRSPREIAVMDLLPTVTGIKHARARLRRWMRPERRRANFPFSLAGARATVVPVPKGVVGIVAPWNLPYGLAVGPAIGALAAGNRVMLKLSEHAPATAEVLAELIVARFDPEEIAVCLGDDVVARAFCALPFDHLVFTGSVAVGHQVMAAAAANLVPVTLELGGKSPAIVGTSASFARAIPKIVLGKMLNAGQVCIAPDYVLVPRACRDDFVRQVVATATTLFPKPASNPDYGGILGLRRSDRLTAIVADAVAKGARVTVVGDAGVGGRMPLHLLENVDDSMLAMQEELFGPILPVIGYDDFDAALAFVNARAKPLALYYFGEDRAERDAVIARTRSGGVTINDTHHHCLQDDLPFGGAGLSGMGCYHGQDGFREFSHRRAVYRQTRFDLMKAIGFRPPYGAAFDRFLKSQLR